MDFSCCFMKWEFFFPFQAKRSSCRLAVEAVGSFPPVPNTILDLIQSPDVDGGRIEEPRR